MLFMPAPTLIGGPSALTYADFQAHIGTLALNGATAWGSPPASNNARYRTTAAAATGSMQGSTWQQSARTATSDVCRMVQHALPSQAVFEAQIAAARQIYFRVQDFGNGVNFGSYSRNGYTSGGVNTGEDEAATYFTDIIYWDGTQAWRVNPTTGTGPIPYTWS